MKGSQINNKKDVALQIFITFILVSYSSTVGEFTMSLGPDPFSVEKRRFKVRVKWVVVSAHNVVFMLDPSDSHVFLGHFIALNAGENSSVDSSKIKYLMEVYSLTFRYQ